MTTLTTEPLPSLTFTITTTALHTSMLVGIFLVGISAYSLAPERDREFNSAAACTCVSVCLSTAEIKLKSACFYQGPTMHPFAFRTHAHSHALSCSGHVIGI